MDYITKEEVIELLDKIESQKTLAFIYTIVKRLVSGNVSSQ